MGGLIHDAAERLRASGSESARLDAELLLGHVVKLDRASLLASPEAPVGADHVAQFEELVARRARGEPVAYIRGLKEFYGLALVVDSRALIPRPETELLVDLGLARMRYMLTERPRPADGRPIIVWDVGTGSGAICVAMAVEARRRGYAADVAFRATDASADALALATLNAVSHGVADRVEFAVADLTDVPAAPPADILLANMPYIPSSVIPTLPIAASFEPMAALDGGADGLDLFRRLVGQLPDAVGANGVAMLELGAGQADAVREEAGARLPGWEVLVHDDLSGVARVVELQRAADARSSQ